MSVTSSGLKKTCRGTKERGEDGGSGGAGGKVGMHASTATIAAFSRLTQISIPPHVCNSRVEGENG